MKKQILMVLGATALLLGSVAPLSYAALTPYFPTPHPTEVDLDIILANLFGPPSNYVRIDDSLDNVLAGWHGGSAVAKYAGNVQNFGYFAGSSGGTFTSLMIVPPTPLGTWFAIPDMPDFRFGINSPDGSGVFFNSNAVENPFLGDHMISFEVTSGPSAGDRIIAWEDLPFNVSDRDYNDLVVQISPLNPIPEPATLVLLGLGSMVLGLVTSRRRRRV